MLLLILTLSLFSSVFVNGKTTLSLNSGSYSWTVHNDSSSEKIEAKVPGGIYSDLNLAQDLLFRQNDIAYRWVALENWTYETTFELPEEILNKTTINLVFHGVDTIGDIYLNGQLIKSVNNMFVRYVIPIKETAKESNVLEVRLKSPVIAAKELADAEGYEIIEECPDNRIHGECHRNFLRKMQASFGWEIGPAFPSVGIWKPVEIEAFDVVLVRDLVGKTRQENGNYFFDYACYIDTTDKDNDFNWMMLVTLRLTYIPYVIKSKTHFSKAECYKGPYSIMCNRTIDLQEGFINVTQYLWWPNGYGGQNSDRWELSCQIQSFEVDGDNMTITDNDEVRLKVGVRSIELAEDEITPGEDGLSYKLKVNGIPVFVKGTNWIPGHILPELSHDEKALRSALQSVKDANMNMIRVWGGGVYESDLFYDICDELGIMVWQDMMFSRTLYPSNKNYLQSVAMEVEQQIKRLARHPSIVVWSGNDENELLISAVKYLGIAPDANLTYMYINDYLKLYVDTVKPIIELHDNSRPFVVSSLTNGLKSIEDYYVAENPMSPLYGTGMHIPTKDITDTTLLANSRFFTRFGYSSMSSFKTISNVSLPDDWSLQSEFSVNREHYGSAYTTMTTLIKSFLPLPEDDGSLEFFKTYIYYSQITQAVGTQLASETYRIDRDRLKDGNEGMTSGILLWHLNDVWQGPTWSSIEFGGRWKMLHYYAVKFFAPLIVVPQATDDLLNVYVVSDLLKDVTYDLEMKTYSWDKFGEIHTRLSNGVANGSRSDLAQTIAYKDLYDSIGCTETTCFTSFKLTAGRYTSENIFYPSSLAKVTNLKPANITVDVTRDENSNVILIDLRTDAIAPFVWLETDEEGIFSDNGFTLWTESKQLKFGNREEEEIDIENFKNTLTVRSLLK